MEENLIFPIEAIKRPPLFCETFFVYFPRYKLRENLPREIWRRRKRAPILSAYPNFPPSGKPMNSRRGVDIRRRAAASERVRGEVQTLAKLFQYLVRFSPIRSRLAPPANKTVKRNWKKSRW
jgi:hypothetical protein